MIYAYKKYFLTAEMRERQLDMPNVNYLTVQQFNEQYPAFTLGTLRRLIFDAGKNGFEKVIRRISPTGGRGRIFINVSAFFEWVEEQNKGLT